MDWVILSLWSLWFPVSAYWLVIHGALGVWRRTGKRTYWIALVIWSGLGWVFLGHRAFWMDGGFRGNLPAVVAGMELVAMELAISSRVGSAFGFARLVGRHEVEPSRFGGGLLTGGLHARVRHPRYLGAMCALFGLALIAGSWRLLAAAAASVPAYFLVTFLEEGELRARFGAEYERYRREVPRFFPRVIRKQRVRGGES